MTNCNLFARLLFRFLLTILTEIKKLFWHLLMGHDLCEKALSFNSTAKPGKFSCDRPFNYLVLGRMGAEQRSAASHTPARVNPARRALCQGPYL
jgi:hypothetical protein